MTNKITQLATIAFAIIIGIAIVIIEEYRIGKRNTVIILLKAEQAGLEETFKTLQETKTANEFIATAAIEVQKKTIKTTREKYAQCLDLVKSFQEEVVTQDLKRKKDAEQQSSFNQALVDAPRCLHDPLPSELQFFRTKSSKGVRYQH